MIFTILTGITLDVTFWTLKKMYGICKWAIFGNSKSETMLLLENQTKIIEMLKINYIN